MLNVTAGPCGPVGPGGPADPTGPCGPKKHCGLIVAPDPATIALTRRISINSLGVGVCDIYKYAKTYVPNTNFHTV